MLVIVMHNDPRYIDALSGIANKKGINGGVIIREKGLGVRLIGGESDVLLTKGKFITAYDMAFVVVIKPKEKRDDFIETIQESPELEKLNLETKGFICTIPFKYIKHLELESL